MYKTIVVGTDGSPTADRAVEAATVLAKECGARLHVVTAYRSMSPAVVSLAGPVMVDTGAELAMRQEAANEIGERAVAQWGAQLDCEHHAVLGDPVTAILDTAERLDADLVVVGSKGMRGARRVLGSVPNSVSHGAGCAVLIVKTD